MKQLNPRDKVTQHMTRDGLTLDNQTTGESINISSREAEQDYSAAEPGGTAEKVLERAGDIRERSKAKRAAKDGANTAAQATGPASRLQFTAEERADPALSKYVHKAEKRADKLDAAKEALPKKRVVTTETVYDEAKGKAKTKLHFDKVEKPAPKLKPNPASRRWRKRACICMEKSMRLSMRMWASRADIREKNLPSAMREKPSAAASGVISSNPTEPQPRPRKRPLPPMWSTSTRNPCGTTRKWRRR